LYGYREKGMFETDKIFVELNDNRIIGTPISWYPNLSKGSGEQLSNYELWNDGQWIHWEELDEDLSAEGFLVFDKEAKIT
jgi:hypothetical protein